MAAPPEGMPCWADAMFADLEGAKDFYGGVLGWTFGESDAEYGDYTQAYSDGKAVAAVYPQMPGQPNRSAWCLYFASPDIAETARKISDNDGEVLVEPMRVGEFGSLMVARDPGGVVFGVWQPGRHEGFEKRDTPGSYCWAEVFTRAPAEADAFFPAVFPFTVRRLEDDAVDFKLFDLGGRSVLGRMRMTDDFPPEVPPYINVFFAVGDCDAAVAKATERGGRLHFGPMDSPFGRFAALSDPQGAAFAVIDTGSTKGEMPRMTTES
ncbi:VOC family protein [Streptomyces sp. NPDC053048]|uniref:VOC family protein n=1 Tax=Streptomyces sp. NPDC053048 TaxID=3365694 RepID=UPI0037CF9068